MAAAPRPPRQLFADESFPGSPATPSRTDRFAARFWSDNLTALLADPRVLTTLRPSPSSGQAPEGEHTLVLTPGWYELAGDPFSVRWWSGNDWIGQPVPFVPSMLEGSPVTR